MKTAEKVKLTKEEHLKVYFDILKNHPRLSRREQADELEVSITTVRSYETSAAEAGFVKVEDGVPLLCADGPSEELAAAVIRFDADKARKEEEERILRRSGRSGRNTASLPIGSLPPSEQFLQDERLRKILNKRPSRWTAKECGIIEVADCCYRMYRRNEGKIEDSALPVHDIYPRLQRLLDNGSGIDDYYKIKWTFEVISKDFTHATLYMSIAESSAALLSYRLCSCYKTSSVYTCSDDIEQILSDEGRSLNMNTLLMILYAANYDRLIEDRHKLQDAFDCVSGYNVEIGIMQDTLGLIGLEAVMKDIEPVRKNMKLLNELVSDLCRQILSFNQASEEEFTKILQRMSGMHSLFTGEGRQQVVDKLRAAFPDLQTVGLDEYQEGTVEWKDRQEKEKEARKILKRKYPDLALQDKDMFIRILWSREAG